MKKVQLFFVTMLLLGAVACRKNSSTLPPVNSNVSNAEAASMVAGSVSINSNGVASLAGDATIDATGIGSLHDVCGTIKSDSISRQSSAGSAVTFSYKLKYNYTVDCNSSSQPDSLSSTLTYSGSFSGPNLSSSNSGSSVFTVNGLLPTATDFVINGEFKRAGSFSSKVDTTHHGNSNIDIVINSLTILKHSRNIVSGNAAISVTGDVPKKGSFSYTGTLVFNGNGTATLTLNGTVYMIKLDTGDFARV
ncbi:MAG TPA: hypothetical protein VNX40_01300 [Mucilaginibacter sp.]|jgi:hypothetical protein|nr:hypothetical protein [Mucilaginibacter sp.]